MKYALLYDGLEYWRRETPDKAALVRDGIEAVTYGELGNWTDGIGAKLQALGVKPGDTVGVAGANCLEWVAAAAAVLKAGGILVPVNERFVRDEMAYLLDYGRVKVVVADPQRAEVARSTGLDIEILPMEGLGAYRSGAPGWKPPPISADQVAMIIFTSGTTGRPKGVMFTHGEHMGNYYQLLNTDPAFGPHMRQLLTVSMQSGIGTMWGWVFCFSVGGSFHYLTKYDPAELLRIVVQERITFLPTMPLAFEQVSRLPEFETADLSSIAAAHVGGARVPPEMLAKWRAKGVILRQMYGQTEVGGYATIATDKEVKAGKQTCGHGMIHTQVRVVRPDGTDCAPNEPGEVRVKGPGVMLGYWRNPEATAQTLVDGWIHTGDLGIFDEDGDFQFVDRAKDMIITGGFNVSPLEVERVIGQLDRIVEVAVITVPDEKFGETPAACIYANAPITAEEVFAHCKERLAGFKLPRYVIPLDEPLPRMSSGKVNKRQLAAEYADAPQRFAKLG